jgi:hypothetical protein
LTAANTRLNIDDTIHTEKVYFSKDEEVQKESIEPHPQEPPSHWPARIRVDPARPFAHSVGGVDVVCACGQQGMLNKLSSPKGNNQR